MRSSPLGPTSPPLAPPRAGSPADSPSGEQGLQGVWPLGQTGHWEGRFPQPSPSHLTASCGAQSTRLRVLPEREVAQQSRQGIKTAPIGPRYWLAAPKATDCSGEKGKMGSSARSLLKAPKAVVSLGLHEEHSPGVSETVSPWQWQLQFVPRDAAGGRTCPGNPDPVLLPVCNKIKSLMKFSEFGVFLWACSLN